MIVCTWTTRERQAEVTASTPGSRLSPPLADPIQFRTSGVDACDHSECFLFSYDLHRRYRETGGRPRILMNPAVRVAYEKTWYRWNNIVLRRPIIRWWLGMILQVVTHESARLTSQLFGVMALGTSCSTGPLNISVDGGTIVPGLD
jgi:hypothetical protein